MGLIIIPKSQYEGSGSSADLPNAATLSKFSVDNEGNLLFDGKIISTGSAEVPFFTILTKQHIRDKFIELPNDCDTSQIITLSIQGIQMQQGSDWEVIAKDWPVKDQIAWEGLGLETLAQVGDKIQISYYRK